LYGHDKTFFSGPAYSIFRTSRPSPEPDGGGLARRLHKFQYRSEYAVLHLFDNEGNYQTSKSFTRGKGVLAKGSILTDKLEEWVSELGEVTYCDIENKTLSNYHRRIYFWTHSDFHNRTTQPSPTT
jgi:hypothetical protein